MKLRYGRLVLSGMLVLSPLLPAAADNLVPNPGFEQVGTDGAPVHWLPRPTTELGNSLERDQAGRDGSAAIAIRTAQATGVMPHWLTSVGGAVAGQQYEVRVWMAVEDTVPSPTNAVPQFKVMQFNAKGELIARPAPGIPLKHVQTILRPKPGVAGWQELSAQFAADADVHNLLLQFEPTRGFRGVARCDDVQIVPVPAGAGGPH